MMLLKIVSFLSLFLLKQQHTNFLNSFLNSKSNLQYIIIFMLEFRRMNTSIKELVRTVLGQKIRILIIVWQQKKKPTIAKIFLLSACSTFLETCPSVSSSIWLLVCLTFYKKNMLGEADWILEELKLSPFEFLPAYEGIVWAPWRRMVVHKWPSMCHRSPSKEDELWGLPGARARWPGPLGKRPVQTSSTILGSLENGLYI